MSQIALDGFDIISIFDTYYGEGMSQIVQASFRDPHFSHNGFISAYRKRVVVFVWKYVVHNTHL